MVSRSDHSSSGGQVLGLNTEPSVFLRPLSTMMMRVKKPWAEKNLKENFYTMFSLFYSYSGTEIPDWENKSLPKYKDEILRDIFVSQ